jgi:hypothetical protein
VVAALGGVAFLAAGLIGEVWQNRFGPGRVGEIAEGLSIVSRSAPDGPIRSGGGREAGARARWRRGAGCSCPDRR